MSSEESGASLVEVMASGDGPAEIAQGMCEQASPLLVPTRDWHAGLQARILDRWGPAIDAMQLLLYASTSIRDAFIERPEGETDEQRSGREVVAIILADRGLLVGEEVLSLSRSGLAAGAFIRWRGLHELALRAAVIAESSEETAQRFHDHARFQARGLGISYNFWARGVDEELLDRAELERYEAERRRLVEQYGDEFSGDYGWAHAVLMRRSDAYRKEATAGKRVRGPTALDLAKATGLEQEHLDYRIASQLAHGADPSAFVGGDTERATLVSTPSSDGIGRPLQLAASSLAAVTAAMVSSSGLGPDSKLDRCVAVGFELAGCVAEACSGGHVD